jgi:hypothetical protein
MHARGLRLRGVRRVLAFTHPSVLPSAMLNDVGTPVAIISQFHTLPALPLSTLRWQPYGRPRMTRVQDGSLHLSCMTLSFTTPRRFIPAHSASC